MERAAAAPQRDPPVLWLPMSGYSGAGVRPAHEPPADERALRTAKEQGLSGAGPVVKGLRGRPRHPSSEVVREGTGSCGDYLCLLVPRPSADQMLANGSSSRIPRPSELLREAPQSEIGLELGSRRRESNSHRSR
jgi:hypothetical protein